MAHFALNPGEAADTLELLRTPARRADPAAVTALVDRLFDGGAVSFVRDQLTVWADAVRRDPTLAAVPDLAAVADELVERVQQAARAITANLQGNAA